MVALTKAMAKVDDEVEEDSGSEGDGDGDGERDGDGEDEREGDGESETREEKFRKTVAARQARKHRSSMHTQGDREEGMGPRLPGS